MPPDDDTRHSLEEEARGIIEKEARAREALVGGIAMLTCTSYFAPSEDMKTNFDEPLRNKHVCLLQKAFPAGGAEGHRAAHEGLEHSCFHGQKRGRKGTHS